MSRVVAKGRFRVDRRRALEKLEKFQLEDPLRYVLEWLAAAVVDGAPRIEVRNDSDDFEIAWVGGPLGVGDLDALFDHVFGRPSDERQAVLQHLAVGVLGALARSPRWLHLDVDGPEGPHRLAVDDPADCAAEVLPAKVGGLRCHVRDRLTQETALEALLWAFREPAEARLIRGAARWCPVPVVVNGTPLPPPAAPEGALVAWSDEDAALWVVPDESGHGVDVVRHGIVVHQLAMTLPPCRVVGWVRGDGVRLNASRSAVVDRDLAPVVKRLESAVDRLLIEALPSANKRRDEEVRWGERSLGFPRARARRGELIDALVVHGLRRGGAVAKALSALPVLLDLQGRRWSLEHLRLERAVGWLDDESLAPWGDPEAVWFAASWSDLLGTVRGAEDQSHALRVARAVGLRQAALQQQPRTPWAVDGRPPVLDRATPLGGEQGRLGMSLLPQGLDQVRIQLLIDGVEVAVVIRPGVGVGVGALVDGPFTLAGLDAEVQHDAVHEAAIAAVEASIWPLIQQTLAASEASTERLSLLTRVLRPVLGGAEGKAERRRRLTALPATLRRLALVPWQGRMLTLDELFDSVAPAFVADRLPAACPARVAEQTLVVPGRLVHDWAAWLDVAEPGRDALDRAVRRAHKLAGPRQEARLVPPPAHHTMVVHGGLSGELGHGGFGGEGLVSRLSRRAWLSASTGVTVLWQGVEVGMVEVPQLPGAVGIVEGPDLPLDPELRLTPEAKRRVEQWVARGTLRLVLSLWDEVPADEALPHALMDWLVRRHSHLPEAEARRRVLSRVNGEPLTLADLRRLDRRKKGSRKLVVLRRHPGDVPGFAEAVVVTETERKLLVALSKRGWREGDRDLRDAREQLENLTRLPAFQPPLRPLAHRAVSGRGWTGHAYIPAEPTEAGKLEVVALFRGRRLATRHATTSAGVLLVVEGLTPNRRCTDVADSKALTRLKDHAEDLLVDLLEDLLAADLPPVSQLPGLRAATARVKAAGRRNKDLAKLARRLGRQKLLPTLDGAVWTPDQVAVRTAAGKPVVRVSPGTRQGPADHAGYLLNEPGVAELLRAWMGKPAPDGTSGLAAWREGQRRLATTPRITPRPRGAVHWAVDEVGLSGFVSLIHREPGLTIESLCDGVPLAELWEPLPLPLFASVTGEPIAATADWKQVADPARVRAEVRAAVVATIDAAVAAGELRGLSAQQWVVWRGPEGPAAEAPLFRQVGGLPASLAELTERAQVYMVSHDRIAPPCGWPALLRPPLALSQWVRLVDLDPLLAVMDQAPRDQPPVGVLAEQAVPGGVLWASEVATPRIDVLLERRVVAQLSPPPGLAIEGAVSGDGVRPRADGRGLVDDAAAAALQERLRGWADGLVEALSRQLPEGDRAAAVLRRALVAKLSEPRGLAALRERKDPLLRVDLFFDSEGRVGTLSDVLAGGEVGVVDADLRGAPDDGRWWRLSGPLREALARHRKVVDQTHRLRALLEGRKRRSVPFRRPEAPPRAVEGETGGVHWALWAGSTYAAEDGIEVLVGGARVQTLDLGGLGLTGFVDGELETDLAFREAVLPRPLRQALETGAVDALAQELAERPAQWMGRMGFARRHGVRLAAGPAGRVVVAASAKGRDVTVAALVKKPGRFRWAEEGVPFAGSAAQVLVGPGERRRWIAHGLGIPLPEVDPPSPEPTDVGPVVATARKLATDARRKELVKVAKEAPEALIRASEDDEATRLLVAWGVASRADSDDDEWALLDRLVRELTGVFGRS